MRNNLHQLMNHVFELLNIEYLVQRKIMKVNNQMTMDDYQSKERSLIMKFDLINE